MAALPYMPLFVADYLADTAHLTAAQHGAYMLLIMNYWQRGKGLPDEDTFLAKVARMSRRDWAHNREPILAFFTKQESLLVHARIAHELSRVASKSLKSKKAAQASVQRRFGERSADVEPTDTDKDKEESKEESKEAPQSGFAFIGRVIRLTEADFDQWRKAYPSLDLLAYLQSRDDWLASEADEKTRKKWFLSTSNHLANLQQKASASDRVDEFAWDGGA